MAELMRMERATLDQARNIFSQPQPKRNKRNAAVATASTDRKFKSVTFQPEVRQRVQARWMLGKKEQIPPRGERVLCGQFFQATVTYVDQDKKKASFIYTLDNMTETDVLFTSMKEN
eukprot:2338673-Pleurochrysis_carterae.AAC.1